MTDNVDKNYDNFRLVVVHCHHFATNPATECEAADVIEKTLDSFYMDYTVLSQFYSKDVRNPKNSEEYKQFITIANPVRLWIGVIQSM